MKTADLFNYDLDYNTLIAGVDEAGRGPLAGPVVVASCIISEYIEGINDSKKISEKKREVLFELIKEKAISYYVSVIDEKTIDRINILNATKRGMESSISNLSIVPGLVLIDAVTGLNVSIETKSIIKGDAISYSIAAASILAKVTRDRIMRDYDSIYPEYGFIQNKGYGTKKHIDALKKFGPCEIHRRTFIGNFINDEKRH